MSEAEEDSGPAAAPAANAAAAILQARLLLVLLLQGAPLIPLLERTGMDITLQVSREGAPAVACCSTAI